MQNIPTANSVSSKSVKKLTKITTPKTEEPKAVAKKTEEPKAVKPNVKTENVEDAEYDSKLDAVYRQVEDREHVLLRPDIYIGSTSITYCPRWVVEIDEPNTKQNISDDTASEKSVETQTEKKSKKLVSKTAVGSKPTIMKMVYRDNLPYIAGLCKIFDEAISNARDHALRMTFSQRPDKRPVTYIDVSISRETGWISIQNDGLGIDVAKHGDLHIYYPELIFGHFRSSTNYDEDRVFNTGAGKNGFGIKLTLVWSKEAVLETVDSGRGLKYTQRFINNLETIEPPVIEKVRAGSKPYTCIRFLPDYVRFGLKEGRISDEMYSLLHKRVLDIAGVSGPGLGLGEGAVVSDVKGVGAEKGRGITVRFIEGPNASKSDQATRSGAEINIRNFQQYIGLYMGQQTRVYETTHPRWEYAVALTPTDNFMHVSFVNGISTANGGSHVDYILGQITAKLVKLIEQKKKVKVSTASLKQQIILFLRCDVEEPSFDNQSKDRLVMPVGKFGSSCTVSDTFVEGVYKLGVADFAMKMTNMREEKKSDGKKKKTILGIPKYSGALYAGTKRSNEAVLILTEGDSAKASALAGMTEAERPFYGVFPLKGKLLNVRDEMATKIAQNEEIANLKRILGLEQGRKYATLDEVHTHLRYSKILILCDQDHDGSHIKGLLVNLFQSQWPELFRIPGFLAFMNTPIMTATKGQSEHMFYNNGEYESWKEKLGGNTRGWTIKYFKGLGTSTSKEFRKYFANKKIVDFKYSGEKSDDAVDMVFKKKRADDRKIWMEKYDRNLYLDTSKSTVAYEEFFDNEMIHFSVYSCERALPNVIDGMKNSQRKILFCAFKRNLVSELKVAQFAGYVSEHACYHHGETSLGGAIIGMAQTFVGSNNINTLMPCGQFGTRILGGNDAASVRYIFTRLNTLTRAIFPKEDDAILSYLDDDGTRIEPEYYLPIIPMILVNGCEGIGTGYSCSIPAFNPREIIDALRERICRSVSTVNKGQKEWLPYYEGFTGNIEAVGKGKYLTRGIYTRSVQEDDVIHISELPIGTWTGYLYYKKFLDEMAAGKCDDKGKQIAPPLIREYQMIESEMRVNITVRFMNADQIDVLERITDKNGINGIEKLLALTSTLSTQNMMMFDTHCKLRKFENVESILDEFYVVRYAAYRKRKEHLLRTMEAMVKRLSNKARFIQEIVAGRIDLRKTKDDMEVDTLLTDMKFDRLNSTAPSSFSSFEDLSTTAITTEEGGVESGDFKYLTEMRLNTLTKERANKLLKERDEAMAQLTELESTTLETMWLRELDMLSEKYGEYKTWRYSLQNPENPTAGGKSTTLKVRSKLSKLNGSKSA